MSSLNGGRVGDIGVQLSQLADSPGGIYGNRTVGQLSWTGEKVWEWGTEAPGGAARQNHDWELLENGNRLILVAMPREVPALGPHLVGDQGIYEAAPDGRIVWEWKAGNHLDELGFTADGFEYLRRSVARQPDNVWGYLEINSAKTLGPSHWHRDDPNTVFHPDNILISSRKANIVALVERTSGRIVWGLRFPDSTTRTSSPTGFRARGTCSCSTTRAARAIRLRPLVLRRFASTGNRPGHQARRVAVHRGGFGPPAVDVLPFVRQ